MQKAISIKAPINADFVLSPQVHYGESLTGIYFTTDDEQYGRVTFENLDTIKISRGEYLPFEDDWKEGDSYCWVTKIENSEWLKERHSYESENYGSSYEFDGNVDEMLSDFSHYVFSFHDEFVEVIARGIWFEKDSENLFGKGLLSEHPFLPVSTEKVVKFEAYGLICQARINVENNKSLEDSSFFCSQKLIEFALELDGNASINNSLTLAYRNGQLMSSLRGYFGKEIMEFDGTASLDDAKPYILSYMKEVSERRKTMGK